VLIKLALETIGKFEFGQLLLLEFMRDHILPYMEDNDKEIRQAAAMACCKVLERYAAITANAAHGKDSLGESMQPSLKSKDLFVANVSLYMALTVTIEPVS
jgi:serine/threonine-protein kinase mTOR